MTGANSSEAAADKVTEHAANERPAASTAVRLENKDTASSRLASELFIALWCVAVAFHLSLPDARQLAWLFPNLLLAGGSCVVASLTLRSRSRPRSALRSSTLWRAAWLMCVTGLVWPLVSLGDTLTQSVLLALIAGAGLWLDTASQRRAASRLTPVVYGTAAFHKLNGDFLNPATSCATGGMELLLENWGLETTELGAWLLASAHPGATNSMAAGSAQVGLASEMSFLNWPLLFLIAELTLMLLLFFRPRYGAALAALTHLPLTIVFAPAFAWVMAPGVFACLPAREVSALSRFAKRRGRRVLAVGLTLAALSMALYFQTHWVAYPAWQLSELLLWALASLLVGFLFSAEARELRSDGATATATAKEKETETGASAACVGDATNHRAERSSAGICVTSRLTGHVTAGLMMLWLLNAATPYLGLQFHHTAAMLSNLRVDDTCWNHLLVPRPSWRRDPYLRVNHISIAIGSQLQQSASNTSGDLHAPRPLEIAALRDEYQAALWEPARFARQVAADCERGLSLSVSFTLRGETWRQDDACAALVVRTNHWGARTSLTVARDLATESEPESQAQAETFVLRDAGQRLFQRNLTRGCAQRCIH